MTEIKNKPLTHYTITQAIGNLIKVDNKMPALERDIVTQSISV